MVSLTQTLLSIFGSRVVLPKTGILMNNGIMWFDPRPGNPNSMTPGGKRPLSNMCPIILEKDGAPWAAIGASGGRRIMPAVFQYAMHLAVCGMDLETASHHPRIDVSGEGRCNVDPRLGQSVHDAIAALMPAVQAEALPVYSAYACPSAVMKQGAGDFIGVSHVMTAPSGGAAG